MNVPIFAPSDVVLRVAIFAKVSSMHLDKLLSWDDMRDSVPSSRSKSKSARISEAHFYTEEKHDLLSRVQIMEMDENGEYVPMEVAQTGELDPGTFQLHQGLQRRITINLSHSSGDVLPWEDVVAIRVGKIQLVDAAGKNPDMGNVTPNIALKMATKPVFRHNANGTRQITINGQWDSSLHGSLLLDRVTGEKYRVQMTISWEISSQKLAEPMRFSQNVFCQILSRSFVRQSSMFSALWQNVRFVHSSTVIFTLKMRPAPIKRVGDLWRMNSQHDYVKGEENLAAWTPRGVSLISDYIGARKKRRRIAEIGAMQNFIKKIGSPEPRAQVTADDDEDMPRLRDIDMDSIDELLQDTPEASQLLDAVIGQGQTNGVTANADEEQSKINGDSSDEANTNGVDYSPTESNGEHRNGELAEGSNGDTHANEVAEEPQQPEQPESEFSERETFILEHSLKLWTSYPDPLTRILHEDNTKPPVNGDPQSPVPPELVATIIRVPKNPTMLKGGYLLVPSSDSTRWIKRFVELRRPYLHIHNVTDGEEVAIVSLRNSRIDSQPGILGLLNGDEDEDGGMDTMNGALETSPQQFRTPQRAGDRSHQHRRSASGSLISSIWTGNQGPSTNGSGHSRAHSRNKSVSSGLAKLSNRLQAAMFAIYGTDNTWLFTARSEKDKLEWIFKIDQAYFSSSGSGSADGSGYASPSMGEY